MLLPAYSLSVPSLRSRIPQQSCWGYILLRSYFEIISRICFSPPLVLLPFIQASVIFHQLVSWLPFMSSHGLFSTLQAEYSDSFKMYYSFAQSFLTPREKKTKSLLWSLRLCTIWPLATSLSSYLSIPLYYSHGCSLLLVQSVAPAWASGPLYWMTPLPEMLFS